METFQRVIEEIAREKDRQNVKWGEAHDARHTLQEWLDIISHEHFEAVVELDSRCENACRREILHVATVAVAALQHYGVPHA